MGDILSSAFSSAANKSGRKEAQGSVSVSLFKELGRTYVSTVSAFADLDNSIIQANDALISDGIVPEERFVSLESAMFIAENFALLIGMLVTNYNGFVDFVTEAVDKETELDEADAETRRRIRSDMHVPDYPKPEHLMEIGITAFSDEVSFRLWESLQKSFDMCSSSRLPNAVNKAASGYTAEHRQILGMILANYIYIIKAFNNNHKFAEETAQRAAAAKKAFLIQ